MASISISRHEPTLREIRQNRMYEEMLQQLDAGELAPLEDISPRDLWELGGRARFSGRAEVLEIIAQAAFTHSVEHLVSDPSLARDYAHYYSHIDGSLQSGVVGSPEKPFVGVIVSYVKTS